MIYRGINRDFVAELECVGCYACYQGRILLLKKPSDHNLYPEQWGVVAGKRNLGEPLFEAVQREAKEEIGHKFPQEMFDYLGMHRVVHPHARFNYHVFRLIIHTLKFEVKRSAEHVEHAWEKPRDAAKYDLIEDESELISHYFHL